MEVVKILEEANEYLAQNTGVVKTVQGTTKHYTGWSETKPHSLSSPGGGGAGPVIHTSYTETIRHDSWASYRYAGHILAYPKVGFIYAGFIADEDKEYDMFVVDRRTTGRVIGKLHEVPGIEHVKEMDLRKHIEPPYRSIPKAVAALRFDQKQGLYAGIDLRSQYKEARDQLDNALPPIIDKHYKWTQVPVVEDDPEPEPYIYPLDPWNDRFDRRGRRRDPYLP